mmetsp:Transcript_6944/g.17264  ORF Transcript_6944/g.17264 Transcript_6944/m.17264 type:complete len:415 (-) Transcript_6944:1198-2442(-)
MTGGCDTLDKLGVGHKQGAVWWKHIKRCAREEGEELSRQPSGIFLSATVQVMDHFREGAVPVATMEARIPYHEDARCNMHGGPELMQLMHKAIEPKIQVGMLAGKPTLRVVKKAPAAAAPGRVSGARGGGAAGRGAAHSAGSARAGLYGAPTPRPGPMSQSTATAAATAAAAHPSKRPHTPAAKAGGVAGTGAASPVSAQGLKRKREETLSEQQQQHLHSRAHTGQAPPAASTGHCQASQAGRKAATQQHPPNAVTEHLVPSLPKLARPVQQQKQTQGPSAIGKCGASADPQPAARAVPAANAQGHNEKAAAQDQLPLKKSRRVQFADPEPHAGAPGTEKQSPPRPRQVAGGAGAQEAPGRAKQPGAAVSSGSYETVGGPAHGQPRTSQPQQPPLHQHQHTGRRRRHRAAAALA